MGDHQQKVAGENSDHFFFAQHPQAAAAVAQPAPSSHIGATAGPRHWAQPESSHIAHEPLSGPAIGVHAIQSHPVLIATLLGWASGRFDSVTDNTPSCICASIESASTKSGSEITRSNRPNVRSLYQ